MPIGNVPTLLRGLKRCCALVLIGLLISCAPGPAPTISDSPPISTVVAPVRPPAFKHIFVIIMENKDYEQIVDNTGQAPYLNELAQQYGLATNYYAITHPSLPNYLALTGGSTFGIDSDCTDCTVPQPNLVDQLEAGGKSWKAYMEGMPRPCFIGDDGPLYRQKHNPFIYYDDIRNNPARCAKIVPFTQFVADTRAQALPDFVWITPNMESDMHDSPIRVGDTWLKTWVPMILDSPAWRDGGALFITFDEGRGNAGCCGNAAGGHIVTLVISPLGKPAYRSAITYTHYSLLRTIEDAWHLPALGGAADPSTMPMSDFFTGSPVGGINLDRTDRKRNEGRR
jgi:phosphatidylinositol-3-phosphatase